MMKDEKYYKEYVVFMEKLLIKGYAYKIPNEEIDPKRGKVWYLPHHAVYHPKKQKLRVVFDCIENMMDVPLMTDSYKALI